MEEVAPELKWEDEDGVVVMMEEEERKRRTRWSSRFWRQA